MAQRRAAIGLLAFSFVCLSAVPGFAQEAGTGLLRHRRHREHVPVAVVLAPAPSTPTVRAAFGEGIGIESADGSFGLGLRARAQIRTTMLVPEDDKEPSADITVRRLRVSFEGFALRKLVTFKIQLAMANQDLDPVAPFIVRDAYANFAVLRDLEIRAGQMKVPYGRQRVVSSGNLQMVDRSVVTGEFNLDRDVGIQVHSGDFLGQHGLLGYNLGLFGGDGRGRASGGYGLLYVGRAEVRLLGGKQAVDLDEPDFARSPKPRLALGISAAYNHLTDRQRSTVGPVFATGPWVNYTHLGFDWTMKWRGLSLTGEAFSRTASRDTNREIVDGKSITDKARAGQGGFIQGGVFATEQLEFTGRLGGIYGAAGQGAALPVEKELGTGVGYYFSKHALKLQSDYFYLFEAWGQGRHQVRLQLQFAP